MWCTAEHSGGSFYGKRAGGLFCGVDTRFVDGQPISEDRHGYHDFDAPTEGPLESPYLGAYSCCTFNLSEPRKWCASNCQMAGAWFADKTQFYCIDGMGNTVTEMPFYLSGSQGTLLAAGEDGRLLFAYRSYGETKFCIYVPQQGM